MISPVDADAVALRAALRRIAPAGVAVGVRRIDAVDLATLRPDEAAMVAAAVPKRRTEFATGRSLLRELIGDGAAIGALVSRAPALPDGVVGSLAHDDTFAVAAVSRDPSIGALGVDVEPVTALAAELVAIILRSDEAGLDAHLAFTLKEAAYKAWSRLGGAILEHHDVALALDGERFTAHVVAHGRAFTGTWTRAAGRWLAIVAAPAVPVRDGGVSR